MTLCIVAPPLLKPSEPGISAGAAAEALRRAGVEARSIDASIGWHRFVSRAPEALRLLKLAEARGAAAGELLAMKRAIASLNNRPSPLQRAVTYEERRVYTSAAREVELGLRLASAEHPRYRFGVAMVTLDPATERVESSAVLARLAREPSPFDRYFLDELIPELDRWGTTMVGVSLSFQQQAPAAFRLASLLRDARPSLPRLLGGPLVDCWRAAQIGLEREPFTLFDHVLAGDDAIQQAAALFRESAPRSAAAQTRAVVRGPLAVHLDEAPWERYLSPVPIIPAALGRGCYWRRCAFCPDHLHPKHRPCAPDELDRWLQEVASRFPDGAMLHLTDSALPPRHMIHLASAIEGDRLPIAWHGFVRVEPELADAEVARNLARGGCAMLQLGVESGSPRLLEMMRKGASVELTRRVLANLGAAGIRAQVYLLFGLPTESDEDREATLSLVEELESTIHAINPALLNLPKQSLMHRRPSKYGITELTPFHAETDLSLYDDFRCGASHPRLEARQWLERRFFKNDAVRRIFKHLRTPFKANHLCFLSRTSPRRDA